MAYRFAGPWDERAGHRFDPSKIVCDPYARVIGGRDVWRAEPDWNDIYQHRARLAFDDFDWEDDRPLETPIKDLVIYEIMCADSLRIHPRKSRPPAHMRILEKIPYLKESRRQLRRVAAHLRVRRVGEQPPAP